MASSSTTCPTESGDTPDRTSNMTHDTLMQQVESFIDTVKSEPDLGKAKAKIDAFYASIGRPSTTAPQGDGSHILYTSVTVFQTCYNKPMTDSQREPFWIGIENRLTEHGYTDAFLNSDPGLLQSDDAAQQSAAEAELRGVMVTRGDQAKALLNKVREVFKKRDEAEKA